MVLQVISVGTVLYIYQALLEPLERIITHSATPIASSSTTQDVNNVGLHTDAGNDEPI